MQLIVIIILLDTLSLLHLVIIAVLLDMLPGIACGFTRVPRTHD